MSGWFIANIGLTGYHIPGGPIVIRGRNVQLGLVSFGESCADPKFPGVCKFNQVSSIFRTALKVNEAPFLTQRTRHCCHIFFWQMLAQTRDTHGYKKPYVLIQIQVIVLMENCPTLMRKGKQRRRFAKIRKALLVQGRKCLCGTACGLAKGLVSGANGMGIDFVRLRVLLRDARLHHKFVHNIAADNCISQELGVSICLD